jgi:hypothetical protein
MLVFPTTSKVSCLDVLVPSDLVLNSNFCALELVYNNDQTEVRIFTVQKGKTTSLDFTNCHNDNHTGNFTK